MAPPTALRSYDHVTGFGTLRVDAEDVTGAPLAATVRVTELGIEVSTGHAADVAVEPWSAESPRLYDVEVSTPTHSVTLRVGFRTVAIVDGVLTVNGAPIKHRLGRRRAAAGGLELVPVDAVELDRCACTTSRSRRRPTA